MTIEELYVAKYKTLVKVAAWKVSPFWAEDVVNESFELLIKHYKPDILEIEKYLNTIFKNVCNKYRQIASNRYHEVKEEDAILEVDSPADQEMIARDFNNYVKNRPAWHREILEMTYILGLREKEIAEMSGRSVASIRQVVSSFKRSIK